MKKLKLFKICSSAARPLLVGIMLLASPAYAMEGPGAYIQQESSLENTASATENTAEAQSSVTEDQMRLAALLQNTETAKKTDQIILLVDHQLSLWNKQSDGSFRMSLSSYAGYGRNGLKLAAERHEGDGTTPIGSFPILMAFGQKENPGTSMTWRTITPNSYWSGEKNTYNTWVESATKIDGEHLSEYTICYEYAMAIGFNTNPTVYKRGSAIFLHVKNPASWSSAGCVSVERDMMLSLLSACHDGAYILIVPEESAISQY